MKHLLLAFSIILALAVPAYAVQQSTINTTIPLANTQVTAAPVRSNFIAAYNDINNLYTLVGTGSGSGTPGGTSGQIQYNCSGAFCGFTLSGDGTINTSTGVLTITKSASSFAVGGNFSVGSGLLFTVASSTGNVNAGTISSGAITAAAISGTTGLFSSTFTLSGQGGSGNQCLHVDNNGIVTGTGSDCGSSGGGSVNSVSGDGALINNVTSTGAVALVLGSSQPGTVWGNATSAFSKPTYSSTIQLGSSGVLGSVTMGNATSGLLTLRPATGALGTVTVSIPALTDTLVNLTGTQTLTNKTLTSPTLTTPTLGIPASGTLTNATGLPITGLVNIGSNTMLSNWTGAAAAVVANTIPSCAADGSHALTYTNATGVLCTSVTGGSSGGVTLGTTLSINNPSISGDLTTGFNTTAAKTIGIAISSTQMLVIGTNTTTGVPQVANNGWISYTQNTDPVLMPHFRKCMTNVNTGNTGGANGGRCRILGIGASVDYGYGSQQAGTDVKTYAWLNQLARYLSAAYGVPADFNGFMGDSDNGQYNTTTGADPRWIALTGLTNATSNLSLGGQPIVSNSNTITSNYKPDQAWDTAVLWVSNFTGGGTFGFQINGGSTTTVNTNATPAVVSHTITTATAAINTLNITCNSANCASSNVFLAGAEFYDSTHPGISVIGAGAYGDTTTNLISTNPNSSAYSPITVLQGIAPDVVIFGGDAIANDSQVPITPATTLSNLTTLFTAITAQSDLICVTSQHAGTPYTDAVLKPYEQVMIQACKAAGGVIADNWSAQNSYSPFTITSGGLNWSFDTAHLTLQGYNDWAANVAYAMLQAVHPMDGMRPAASLWSKQADVNNILVEGAATGLPPTIQAQGTDTNVALELKGQGTSGVGIGTTNTLTDALLVNGAAAAMGPVTVSISTATFTPVFNGSNDYSITLVHASCPCTLANPSGVIVPGQKGVIYVTQSSTGSDTITTWGSDYVYAGGTSTIALSTAANAIDVFSYVAKDATHIVLSGPTLNVTH